MTLQQAIDSVSFKEGSRVYLIYSTHTTVVTGTKTGYHIENIPNG
jgi:hypothetical protein